MKVKVYADEVVRMVGLELAERFNMDRAKVIAELEAERSGLFGKWEWWLNVEITEKK